MVLLCFALERYGPRTPSGRRLVAGAISPFALVGALCSIRPGFGICLAKATSVFVTYLSMCRVHIDRDLNRCFYVHWLCRSYGHRWRMGIASLDFRLYDSTADLRRVGLCLRPRVMEQIKNANGPMDRITMPAALSAFRLRSRLGCRKQVVIGHRGR